jgi:hypothetical protein
MNIRRSAAACWVDTAAAGTHMETVSVPACNCSQQVIDLVPGLAFERSELVLDHSRADLAPKHYTEPLQVDLLTTAEDDSADLP